MDGSWKSCADKSVTVEHISKTMHRPTRLRQYKKSHQNTRIFYRFAGVRTIDRHWLQCELLAEHPTRCAHAFRLFATRDNLIIILLHTGICKYLKYLHLFTIRQQWARSSTIAMTFIEFNQWLTSAGRNSIEQIQNYLLLKWPNGERYLFVFYSSIF